MTSWLARIAVGRTRLILIVAVIVFIGAGAFGIPVVSHLSPPGNDVNAESTKASVLYRKATGESIAPAVVALVTPKAGVSSAAGKARVHEIATELAKTRIVKSVQEPFDARGNLNPGAQSMVDKHQKSALVVVSFKSASESTSIDTADALELQFKNDKDVVLGGRAIAEAQIDDTVTSDLVRSEIVAVPILLLLALLFFRGVIAAILPLALAAMVTFLTMSSVRVATEFMPMSSYAINLTTALAMGLGIDYALLMVSRYREALCEFGPGAEAIRKTIATAGRTVLFSAVTVAASLASLMVFPQVYLYSLGFAGLIVSAASALCSLLVMPAVLAALGTRVNALAPARLQRAADRDADHLQQGRWYRLAQVVMRRPWTVAIITGTIMILLGAPFLNIKFTSADETVLPKGKSARTVGERIKRDFPSNNTDPIRVIIKGKPTQAEVADVGVALRGIPGIAQAVQQPLQTKADSSSIAVVNVYTKGAALSPHSQTVVRKVRTSDLNIGKKDVLVGGPTAELVDQQKSLLDRAPLALLIVVSVTLICLFLLTGSLVLPIKAVIMNFLTVSATFGTMVFIFQEGHFESILRFTSQGALESAQPVILCALVFGLSTDYGVFLLSRIKEARDNGASDSEAVAIGLERTGRIVTAAALLFCIAMGSVSTSSLVTVKQIGFGTAFAVLLDATVVRALLVPALMKLLGSRNWWAPKFLRRVGTISHG